MPKSNREIFYVWATALSGNPTNAKAFDISHRAIHFLHQALLVQEILRGNF